MLRINFWESISIVRKSIAELKRILNVMPRDFECHGKISARSWGIRARSCWNYRKILLKLLQDLAKSLQNLVEIMARSCQSYSKILHNHGKIFLKSWRDLKESFQDHVQIMARSCKIIATFCGNQSSNHGKNLSRSCIIIATTYWNHAWKDLVNVIAKSWQNQAGSWQNHAKPMLTTYKVKQLFTVH